MTVLVEGERSLPLGYLLIFIAKDIDCGYMLELPRQGDSKEDLQSMFWIKNKKIYITLYTPDLLYKRGVSGDIHFTEMFS